MCTFYRMKNWDFNIDKRKNGKEEQGIIQYPNIFITDQVKVVIKL